MRTFLFVLGGMAALLAAAVAAFGLGILVPLLVCAAVVLTVVAIGGHLFYALRLSARAKPPRRRLRSFRWHVRAFHKRAWAGFTGGWWRGGPHGTLGPGRGVRH